MVCCFTSIFYIFNILCRLFRVSLLFSSSPVILSIRQSAVFFFSSELKNTHTRKKKKTNLVGLNEKSGDICRDSPLVMGEWVYHCGIYEWPQVCGREGRETEGGRDGPAGALSLLSDVTLVQVCSV